MRYRHPYILDFHGIFLATVFILILSSKSKSQCPTSNLLPNPSFEEQSCCPDDINDLVCLNDWLNPHAGGGTSYYHSCGYMGVIGWNEPPSGFPDGQGCIAPRYLFNSYNTMTMSCAIIGLAADEEYIFSAYAGFNFDNEEAPPVNPVKLGLWASIGDCNNLPTFADHTCPPSTWDLVAEIEYSFAGSQGWVFGQSDCFVAADTYNLFVLAMICDVACPTGRIRMFYDQVGLHSCQPLLDVSLVIEESCGVGANGSVDLIVGNGTPPYVFDWDIDGTGDFDDAEDQDNLASGNYQVVVMDANGLQRCLNVFVNGEDVIETDFDEILPLCQYDPFILLPTTSINDIPVRGTWTPDTILTDVAGTFNYVFHPNSNFCADSFVQTVQIIRSSADTGHVYYEGCVGDGYQQTINGTTYRENNPTGQEIINTNQVCDSLVQIEFIYHQHTDGVYLYSDCSGSGYALTINGMVYDESNPIGTELMTNAQGCDSMIMVELTFLLNSSNTFTHIGCEDDGYALNINGNVYDELNPDGTEILPAVNGCDSTLTIDLEFRPEVIIPIVYNGCFGDGFSILVNGNLYDESNPTGAETMQTSIGCDSTVSIDLNFSNNHLANKSYQGCRGDNYSIEINSTIYDENNPTGIETITNPNGCDTLVQINLQFADTTSHVERYRGCRGDGYSLTINGTVYDENNPSGTEILSNVAGCDSVVAVDFSFTDEVQHDEIHSRCVRDGFSIMVNNVLYDELNPIGIETMTSAAGCDSVVTIDLSFTNEVRHDEIHNRCMGDGFSITVNNVLYNELNPTGTEFMLSADNCDSIVTVDLNFTNEVRHDEIHSRCVGDGFSITVNNVLYDELNPTGMETMVSAAGCDSIVTVDLNFTNEVRHDEIHDHCVGDGFSITVNNVVYDELNPMGTETMTSVAGCDSIVTVDINFTNEVRHDEIHSRCVGDGFFIMVNNVTYDESNPIGTEYMQSIGGCDSIINIDLQFNDEINRLENYMGCVGDGFSVTVNQVVYNETNPIGVETMISTGGCDSIVSIDLQFNVEYSRQVLYSGCAGDGFSVVVNTILYDEANPAGLEIMQSNAGCDSIVTIDLQFNAEIVQNQSHQGCENDGYAIAVNNVIYNESNPVGQEIMQSTSGCDSVVHINLQFDSEITEIEYYSGCIGDGYAVIINNTQYDESNPVGIENMVTASGCDSVVSVQLEFLEMIELDHLYAGCVGDGYAITINNIVFDENNPTGIEIISGGAHCDTLIAVELIFESAIEQNESIVLDADHRTIDLTAYISQLDSIETIVWSPTANLSCTDCFISKYLGEASANFTIALEDQSCDHIIHLNVAFEPIQTSIFIPTVFSPNNDGINDYFIPLTSTSAAIDIISFEIFNRWGDRVFVRENVSTRDSILGWDGSIDGRLVGAGVYVYQLRFSEGGVEMILFGDVTLIR